MFFQRAFVGADFARADSRRGISGASSGGDDARALNAGATTRMRTSGHCLIRAEHFTTVTDSAFKAAHSFNQSRTNPICIDRLYDKCLPIVDKQIP